MPLLIWFSYAKLKVQRGGRQNPRVHRKDKAMSAQELVQITTGYVCKRCGGPSPVGVGYAIYGNHRARGDVAACPCGYSVGILFSLDRHRRMALGYEV